MVDKDEFLTVVSEGAGYVRVTVSGPSTGARLLRMLDRVVAESESRGIALVLLDARGVPAPISASDKHAVGVAAGRALGGKIKVAGVARPENVDHLIATVARSHGANVLSFTDEAAALEWLLGGAAPSTR